MYSSAPSLPHLLYTAVQNSALDIQPSLLANIVISGGNTMWRGLEQRLLREITVLRGKGGQHISAIEARKYGSWIGGSVLSSLSTFQQLWVSRAEYDEYGPTVVHTKCF
jgi:actin-related protein